MGLSIWQLLIILAIVVLVLGPSRIPLLGKSFGEFMRALKSGREGKSDIDVTEASKKKLED